METTVSKSDVRGTASGVMFMAFFGTVWADVGNRRFTGITFGMVVAFSHIDWCYFIFFWGCLN
ncbi:hypothetical protein [Bacillus sp. RAR_GA_16]|uniref:hypothetical protein n=1 Tax=Bacillus sp. RAR_GA_16 TaxID=2876774 RepID=UPI001CC8F6A6|nr:hypothetical protein [Bacillus sp. RAR_GA_16]MCA0173814.1 hypothetical protein [Bacillus sp. RAR_GA_16]